MLRSLLLILLVGLASGLASTAAAAHDVEPSPDTISLSLSLYIVDEAGASSSSGLSWERDTESMQQVAQGVQAIWEQAGIELMIGSIARIDAPSEALIGLSQGDTTAFLNGLYEGSIEVPGASAVNGFYVRNLGTINGVTSVGTRIFFVTDKPSVHDERVSSHEIGHILGLHHEADDSDGLMFSGTNGMALSGEEIAVARYAAQGIVDGLR